MNSTTKLFNKLLPNQEHLRLQNWELDCDHHRILIAVRSTQSSNACPICEISSQRIHSHYRRKLADCSWADYEIALHLTVRKFFCDNPACERRIFTERLPSVMAPWAQRTQRLGQQLYEIALRLGGMAGAKLSQKLHCGVSRNTLLRLLIKQPLPTYTNPTTLGVDDFAFRKRQTYGTILVDLDRHQPIALLPGRDAVGLAAWLIQHPGVQVLSRDRSPVYKSGMSQGAPDALQVADRFHLLHNLAEVLEQVFRSQITELRRVTSAQDSAHPNDAIDAEKPEAERPDPAASLAVLLETLNIPSETHYQRRRTVHHVIWQLAQQGWSTAAIAQKVGVSIRTVQRDLNKPKFASPQRRVDYGKNLVAPYRAYILKRCLPGQRCVGLLKELRQKGYQGSERTLSRYLNRMWKGERTEAVELPVLPVLPPMNAPEPIAWQPPLSASRATWLVLRKDPPQRVAEQQLLLKLQSSPQLAPAIELAQSFSRLIRQRQPERFEAWLEQALNSQIAAFVNFATGLKEDFEAVQAAMKLKVSNGQVEGQINRLKLLKRQMYGRAGIDLLTRRFLLAS